MAWHLDKTYIRLFLKPAHNHRWAREVITFPRLHDHGQRCIYPENHIQDIQKGFRETGFIPSKSDEPRLFRLPLNPLKDSIRLEKRSDEDRQRMIDKYGQCGSHRRVIVPDTYNRVKHNLCRGTHWLFTQYPEQIDALGGVMEENKVQFDIFDFDVHIDATDAEEQIHQKYLRMYAQIDHAKRISVRYGFTILFLTSPGDLVNGVHHQGRYGLVIFDEPISVSALIQTRKQVKKLLGIDWETAWDSRHRNIRLPGQDWVILCDPDTLNPLSRNDNAQQRHERIANAIKAVSEDEALVPIRRILDEAAQLDLPAAALEHVSSATVNAPTRHSTVSTPGLLDLETCRNQPDTFQVFTFSRKIGHRAAVKYLLDNPSMRRADFIQKATSDFKGEFIASRPSTSRSAQNAERRLQRLFSYYYDTFNPKKLNSNSRAVRNSEDRERILPCLNLDEQLVARSVRKKSKLSYRETCWFLTIYRFLHRFHGRLSWKLLYGPGGIVPKRKWTEFKKKIDWACHWIVDYQAPEDNRKGTCRQWSLTKAFMQTVRRIREMRRYARGLAGALQQYKIVAVQMIRNAVPRGRYRHRMLENQDWIRPVMSHKPENLLEWAA